MAKHGKRYNAAAKAAGTEIHATGAAAALANELSKVKVNEAIELPVATGAAPGAPQQPVAEGADAQHGSGGVWATRRPGRAGWSGRARASGRR